MLVWTLRKLSTFFHEIFTGNVTPHKVEQQLKGMKLHEKEDKDEKHIAKLIRKILVIEKLAIRL